MPLEIDLRCFGEHVFDHEGIGIRTFFHALTR